MNYFLRKIFTIPSEQASWLADRCGAAPSRLDETMAFCGPLPVHSDRIAEDLHLIPYYPPIGGTRKVNLQFSNDRTSICFKIIPFPHKKQCANSSKAVRIYRFSCVKILRGSRGTAGGSLRSIIDKDTFEKVQQMRLERINIVFDPNGGPVGKETHYSSKVKRGKND